MAVLITYQKKDLFAAVKNKSVMLSKVMHKPDFVIDDNKYKFIAEYFCMAGRRVLEMIGAYTKNIQVPYIQTMEGQNFPESNSINFTVATHDNSKDGVMIPLLDSSIREFIVSFAFNEWMKLNSIPPIEDVADKAKQIKRNIEYGNRSRIKINTL